VNTVHSRLVDMLLDNNIIVLILQSIGLRAYLVAKCLGK